MAGNEKQARVALCVTCLVDQLMPEVGVATVKVLRRAGCSVDFPSEQTCCGQPFFNSGFRQRAAELAMRTIEIFETYPTVVLPSGSCTAMIRKEYTHLFDNQPEWQERARKLADKTYELSEFLVNKTEWQVKEDFENEETSRVSETPEVLAAGIGPKSVTYHDSCHMCRSLQLGKEPRQLLKNAGVSLREMEESDRCCGFGGLFSLRLAEVSTAMTAEKLRQAAGTEATTLVTADPGCLMQMRGLASDEEEVQIQHLAIVLEEMSR